MFADPDFAWLNDLRKAHFPAERNQVPAHLTLFHQIPPALAPELDTRIASQVRGRPKLPAHIEGVMDLGGGTAFRVHSEELEEIRGELAEPLRGMLTPQDRAPWRPHVTIQNKVEPREARRLQQELRSGFAPRPLTIVGLGTWTYLGGRWEPRKRYSFRQ